MRKTLSVRSERRKKKEGTGLVGLVHVEAMLAVIECHVAVVQAFLVRQVIRSAYVASLNGVDVTEIFSQIPTSDTAMVFFIAAEYGCAVIMNTRCVTAIIGLFTISLVCFDAISALNIPFARGSGALTVAPSLQQSAGFEPLRSRGCPESSSGGVVLVDSDAGGNILAKHDVWKMEIRRCAHADYRRQDKWNEELEKHDGGTKNTEG